MKPSLFHSINSEATAIRSGTHLVKPVTPFKMLVDAQLNLIVCMTKRDYLEYLSSLDRELCRF